MASKHFSDERGSLYVIDKLLPFEIKRLFYIVNAKGVRGGHRHIKTRQALISVSGGCNIFIQKKNLDEQSVRLDSPDSILIIEPEDWHTMSDFTDDCVLLVLASEIYSADDYIYEKYT